MKPVEEFLMDMNTHIERKCREIKYKKQEKKSEMIFLISCGLIFFIPVILVILKVQVINILLGVLTIGLLVFGIVAITKILGGGEYAKFSKQIYSKYEL